MRYSMKAAFLALLVFTVNSSAFSQLRNISEYSLDRINADQTLFMLRDTGTANYDWASEWSNMTVNAYADKTAMFLWHFSDGTKAYSRQGEFIGDAGQITGYLITGKSSNLEDIHGKSIQPMTRSNFPVKIELWIGEVRDSSGYSPETLVDALCLDAKTIEYNQPYHFAHCQ